MADLHSAGSRQDRTVHATTPDGDQIVRYDRAGKWYIEHPDGFWRIRIRLDQAVRHASQAGSYVYLGRSGRRRFDAAVRASQSLHDPVSSNLYVAVTDQEPELQKPCKRTKSQKGV